MFQALAVFIGTLLIEIGWVLCVRFVQNADTFMLVVTAMIMQSIGYLMTIMIIDDHINMIPGTLAAGLGAIVGMRLKLSQDQK